MTQCPLMNFFVILYLKEFPSFFIYLNLIFIIFIHLWSNGFNMIKFEAALIM